MSAETEAIPQGVEAVETVEAVAAVETEDETPGDAAAAVSEPATSTSDETAGHGEIERVLAAMHHALAELSERFSATVDHIGTLLSPPRNGSAEAPAEGSTGAEAPETLAELANEPPAGEAEVAASTEEAASAESAVEAPGEPQEVPNEPQEVPVEASASHPETTAE